MIQDECQKPANRCVVCVAYDGMGLLELAGMQKVFWEANRLMVSVSQPGYTLHTASLKGGLIDTVQRVTIDTVPLADFDDVSIHTLILPDSTGLPYDTADALSLMKWLAKTLPTVERVIAAGSATFLLARTGALAGRSAVIHWSMSEALKSAEPRVHVDGCSLFAGDECLWTSAGAASAIDLALALVDADCGRAASLRAARDLAVFVRRPGQQSQLSELLISQTYERDAFHDLHLWVQANLDLHVTVDRMAEQVSMSTRNFSRVYKRNTGCTPAKAIERFRLDTSDHHAPS